MSNASTINSTSTHKPDKYYKSMHDKQPGDASYSHGGKHRTSEKLIPPNCVGK
jgi:hypothetical protein